MTSDPQAVRRAATSLRRASRAAAALDGDDLAARLLAAAIRVSEQELAALRSAEAQDLNMPASLVIDGEELFRFFEEDPVE